MLACASLCPDRCGQLAQTVRRLVHDPSRDTGHLEIVAEGFLRERVAALTADEGQIAARPSCQRSDKLRFKPPRNLDPHLLPALLRDERQRAVPDVLLA